MKKTLSLLTLFALTACNSTTVIPGSTIKTRTKTIVYTDTDTAADTNLDSRVAVYPITPNLIEKMRTHPYFPKPTKAWSKAKALTATASAAATSSISWFGRTPTSIPPSSKATRKPTKSAAAPGWMRAVILLTR